MSDNNQNTTNSGIGFAGLLTIVFIVSKLTNYISWSWLWVLSPLWISFGIAVLFVLIVCIVTIICKKRS